LAWTLLRCMYVDAVLSVQVSSGHGPIMWIHVFYKE